MTRFTPTAAATLLAAALLAHPAAGQASPGPAQAVPDGIPPFSVRTDAYELYAPSEAELHPAKEELDSAVVRFRRYFGEAPPRTAVFLFNSSEELRAADTRSFEARGLRPFKWTARGASVGTVMVRPLGDLGVLVGGRTDVAVLQRVAEGAVAGLDLRVGDKIRALNGVVISSAEELNNGYRMAPPGSRIVLDIVRGDQPLTLSFQKPASIAPQQHGRGTPPAGALVQAPGGESKTVAHEVGHEWVKVWASRKTEGAQAPGAASRVASSPAYGHPQLPDWFDEAGAQLMEGPSVAQARRQQISRNIGAFIPLREFVQMEHPMLATLAALHAQQPQQPSGGVTRIMVPDGDGRGPMFYAQSVALASFLAEREGPAFLARVGQELVRGQPFAEVLRQARNVPADLDAFEKEWLRWVAQ